MSHNSIPERDMNRTVFADILKGIDLVCPGFEAAVFYDSEGETIDYFSYLDPFDTRLLAAHLGVVASCAGRNIKKIKWGDIKFIEISAYDKDSITVFMGDDLFISVFVKSGYLDRAIHRKIHDVILKLKKEIDI